MLEAIFQEDTLWRILSTETVLKYTTSGNVLRTLGLASAMLSMYAFAPYIRDTIARRTQPQRASWLIWSVLGCIALVSQIVEGATSSLWFPLFQVGGTITVFLITFKRGIGPMFRDGDMKVLGAAAVGLILWSLTDNSVYALGTTIAISMIGGWATVRKAYLFPVTETMAMWSWSIVASALAMLSVGSLNWVLLAYPLYLFVLYSAVFVAILLGRARNARAQAFQFSLVKAHQPVD